MSSVVQSSLRPEPQPQRAFDNLSRQLHQGFPQSLIEEIFDIEIHPDFFPYLCWGNSQLYKSFNAVNFVKDLDTWIENHVNQSRTRRTDIRPPVLIDNGSLFDAVENYGSLLPHLNPVNSAFLFYNFREIIKLTHANVSTAKLPEHGCGGDNPIVIYSFSNIIHLTDIKRCVVTEPDLDLEVAMQWTSLVDALLGFSMKTLEDASDRGKFSRNLTVEEFYTCLERFAMRYREFAPYISSLFGDKDYYLETFKTTNNETFPLVKAARDAGWQAFIDETSKRPYMHLLIEGMEKLSLPKHAPDIDPFIKKLTPVENDEAWFNADKYIVNLATNDRPVHLHVSHEDFEYYKDFFSNLIKKLNSRSPSSVYFCINQEEVSPLVRHFRRSPYELKPQKLYEKLQDYLTSPDSVKDSPLSSFLELPKGSRDLKLQKFLNFITSLKSIKEQSESEINLIITDRLVDSLPLYENKRPILINFSFLMEGSLKQDLAEKNCLEVGLQKSLSDRRVLQIPNINYMLAFAAHTFQQNPELSLDRPTTFRRQDIDEAFTIFLDTANQNKNSDQNPSRASRTHFPMTYDLILYIKPEEERENVRVVAEL